MKKFYSLALSAAVCLGASAADLNVAVRTIEAAPAAYEAAALTEAPAQAPVKAAPANFEELKGLYDAVYTGYESGTGWKLGFNKSICVVEGTDASTVTLIGFFDIAVEADVDYEAGTLTVPGTMSMGMYNFTDGQYEVVMNHYIPSTTQQGKITAAPDVPCVLTLNADGQIIMGQDDYWLADIIGMGGNYIVPDMCFCGVLTASKQVDAADSNWVTIGTCEFEDRAFVYPMFKYGMEWPNLSCDVQQNTNAANTTIRLVNPYGGMNAALTQHYGEETEINEYGVPGNIEIDMTYPNCLVMKEGYVGFILDSPYLGSTAVTQSLATGDKIEDIMGFVDPSELSAYDEATGVLVLRNCLTNWGSGWRSYKELTSSTTGQPLGSGEFTVMLNVEFGSLGKVIVDENAPVVYYNLQGVRVENPANGLYIRVQGKAAQKVVL